MGFRAPDIAIDLGTTNTLVYVKRKGIVISEPTIVVVEARDKHLVRAVGDEAALLLGRTTEALQAILPIRDGAIQDFDTAAVLLVLQPLAFILFAVGEGIGALALALGEIPFAHKLLDGAPHGDAADGIELRQLGL